FGLHAALHGGGNQLDVAEERAADARREIGERLEMLFRDEQDMAGEQRAAVQERQRNGIFEHDIARKRARSDLAESAASVGSHQLWIGPSPRLSAAIICSFLASAAFTADSMEKA